MTTSAHYTGGQHAAVRGCHRVLCSAPSPEHYEAWYAGYDSVPSDLRGRGPLTGPIPQELLDRINPIFDPRGTLPTTPTKAPHRSNNPLAQRGNHND